MEWHVLDDSGKIRTLILDLISEEEEIKVRIAEEHTEYSTKVVRFEPSGESSERPEEGLLILEKLVPEEGNSLIRTRPEMVAEFSIKRNLCRWPLEYVGVSDTHPYLGFIVRVPVSIEIAERRREERIPYEMPEFVSAEFTLEEGVGKGKRYTLNVLDYSRHGLGMLVVEKDFDLLEFVNPGDGLSNITFFATSAVIKVDGTIRHKTEIAAGNFKGAYILGIESGDILENCEPDRT